MAEEKTGRASGKQFESEIFQPYKLDVAESIRAARESLGLSQADLARAFGRSQSWISEAEKGRSWPPWWLVSILNAGGAGGGVDAGPDWFQLVGSALHPPALRRERMFVIAARLRGISRKSDGQELSNARRHVLNLTGTSVTTYSPETGEFLPLVTDMRAVDEHFGAEAELARRAVEEASRAGTVYERAGGTLHVFAHRGSLASCVDYCRGSWRDFILQESAGL